MATRSRLSIAKPWIETLFRSLDKRVFTTGELEQVFKSHSAEWRLAQSTTGKAFIAYLTAKSYLTKVELEFPRESIVRFIWDQGLDEVAYELGSSLKPNSYLSHFSAMFIHELTDQIPKTIYVTAEQAPKSKSGALTQEAIDAAYSKSARLSQNTTTVGSHTIALLYGMHTGSLGILQRSAMKVTSLERTLIDIAVRPDYSGGVHEVLNAYKVAWGKKISVNTIRAYLKQIQYAYPYYQTVAFYLERAGCPLSRLKLLEQDVSEFDFYLAHGIEQKAYCPRWKVYYPTSLDE